MAEPNTIEKTVLKNIDLVKENSSGSKRVFFTVTITGKDYEHFIDCPLGMTDLPDKYVADNLTKIAMDITKQADSVLSSDTPADFEHPAKVKKIKEIETAKTDADKIALIVELLKNQL